MRDTLKEALHRFRDLLVPPKLAADETETDGVDNNDLEHVSKEPAKPDSACSEGTQTVEVKAESRSDIVKVAWSDTNNGSAPSLAGQNNIEAPPVPSVQEPVQAVEEPEAAPISIELACEPVPDNVVQASDSELEESADELDLQPTENEHDQSLESQVDLTEAENKKKFVITENELKTLDIEVVENEQKTVLDPEG